MLNFIATPFGYIFRFLNSITNNYILSVLLFAVLVEIVLIPLSYKKRKNHIAQMAIKPKLRDIQLKYTDLPEEEAKAKRQEDMVKLYEDNKVSPFAGLFTTLIQFPIVIALYKVVTSPLTFLCGLSSDLVASISEKASQILNVPFASEIQSIIAIKSDFSAFGDIPNFTNLIKTPAELPNISLFGQDLTGTPSFTNLNYLILVPVILFLTSILSAVVTRILSSSFKEFVKSLKSPIACIGLLLSPLLPVIISFSLPVTITIYWIASGMASMTTNIVLTKLLPLPKIDEAHNEGVCDEAANLKEDNVPLVAGEPVIQESPN